MKRLLQRKNFKKHSSAEIIMIIWIEFGTVTRNELYIHEHVSGNIFFILFRIVNDGWSTVRDTKLSITLTFLRSNGEAIGTFITFLLCFIQCRIRFITIFIWRMPFFNVMFGNFFVFTSFSFKNLIWSIQEQP